jgi:hypothetical protein
MLVSFSVVFHKGIRGENDSGELGLDTYGVVGRYPEVNI